MSRECTVCALKDDVEEIDRRLNRCDSIAGIAADYGLEEVL